MIQVHCDECGERTAVSDEQIADCAELTCDFCGTRLDWLVDCAHCSKVIPDVLSWGDGDVGDRSIPSFCSEPCYHAGRT